MFNIRPSELAAVVGVIDPDAYTAETYTTDWIDAGEFNDFMAIIQAGTFGASATVNAKIQQATDNVGTGAKDLVPAKAITALTDAGSDDDKQAVINLSGSELDVNNGFSHFRLSVTIAVQAVDLSAVVLGFNPRHAPASDHDAATVDEIVN